MAFATERNKYIQRAASARRASVDRLTALLRLPFSATEWSGRSFEALAQWPDARFDWHGISHDFRTDPARLDVAIWSGDRLSAIFLSTLTGEAVTLRWVEADPRPDCPLKGKRLLIALDITANYAQLNGRREIRVEPINDHMAVTFESEFGFTVTKVGRNRLSWRKEV